MIGIVGLSYKTAELYIRERLVMQEDEQEILVAYLRERIPDLEVIILCTCNRSEIYFYTAGNQQPGLFDLVLEVLVKCKNMDAGELKKYFYTLEDEKAVRHLFGVAGGLDSLVLGENEILGQVKTAYAWSARRGYTAAVFNRLFHKAFEIGKRIRSETTINQRASSVSSVAIELCEQKLNEQKNGCAAGEKLQELPILMLGAGENGERLLKSLVKKDCWCITVASRTYEHAEALANLYGVRAQRLEQLTSYLGENRIVITSTAAPAPLVTRAMVQRILEENADKSFIYIDLSVPRDIEEEIRVLPRVTLFNMDDLKVIIAENQEKRKEESDKAREIIQTGVNDFFSWLGEQKLKPLVKQLKEKINHITLSSLELLDKNKSGMEMEQVCYMEQLLHLVARIEQKYLGLIIKNLKTVSENGKKAECIKFVNELFGLGE